jgi:hypothetical protein
MSTDPVAYDAEKHKHPSLCSACIHRQGDTVRMLSGYCVTVSRCDGCGRICDLALCVISKPLVTLDSRTGTQNRPYPSDTLMVRATFKWESEEEGMGSRAYVPQKEELVFNWNNRDEVRNFAAQSDRIIRMGGSTTVEQVK